MLHLLREATDGSNSRCNNECKIFVYINEDNSERCTDP